MASRDDLPLAAHARLQESREAASGSKTDQPAFLAPFKTMRIWLRRYAIAISN